MIDPQEVGQYKSPGGFVFGISGWTWGEQQPRGITFFLNGTALVSDQWGRPIRGITTDNKEYWFPMHPPRADDPMPGYVMHEKRKVKLASHMEVIKALEDERIDWHKLNMAGWPQLTYSLLKAMPALPFWPFSGEHNPAPTPGIICTCLKCSIKDPHLRKDAIRIKKEADEALLKEIAAAEIE